MIKKNNNALNLKTFNANNLNSTSKNNNSNSNVMKEANNELIMSSDITKNEKNNLFLINNKIDPDKSFDNTVKALDKTFENMQRTKSLNERYIYNQKISDKYKKKIGPLKIKLNKTKTIRDPININNSLITRNLECLNGNNNKVIIINSNNIYAGGEGISRANTYYTKENNNYKRFRNLNINKKKIDYDLFIKKRPITTCKTFSFDHFPNSFNLPHENKKIFNFKQIKKNNLEEIISNSKINYIAKNDSQKGCDTPISITPTISINISQYIQGNNTKKNQEKITGKVRRLKTVFNNISCSEKENNESTNLDLLNKIFIKYKLPIINSGYKQKVPYSKSQNKVDKAGLLWKKAKMFQKMVNAITHTKVEKIDDSQIFQDNLQKALLGIEGKEEEEINKENAKKNDLKGEISYGQFNRKNEIEKDFVRISLRAKALKLITEGVSDPQTSVLNELSKLFDKNPEKNKCMPDDRNTLFNQKLSNGKTLLYVACQEGDKEVVEFFLKKQLNPNIKVNYFGMDDTCLGVASRWGYVEIVKHLLESGRINESTINSTYESEDTPDNIKKIIEQYLPKKKKEKGCACF